MYVLTSRLDCLLFTEFLGIVRRLDGAPTGAAVQGFVAAALLRGQANSSMDFVCTYLSNLRELRSCDPDSRLLDGVNLLLEEVGLRKRFATVDQLQTTACSMFVAIYEKLFGQLSDIDRNSRAYQSLLDNTEILLHHLRDEVGAHLEIPTAITAELVVSGDIPSIRFLTALFRELKALRDRAVGMWFR